MDQVTYAEGGWIAYYVPGTGEMSGKKELVAVFNIDFPYGVRHQIEEQLQAEFGDIWMSEKFMSLYDISPVEPL